MIKTINLNGREIRYNLERKNVKNINLRIKVDQSINISASVRVSDSVIEEFLNAKAEYILRALDHYAEIAKYAPKPKQYVDSMMSPHNLHWIEFLTILLNFASYST